MFYVAYMHKDKKSDYGVSFPDFPGCITAGKSIEDAQRKAAEALSMHIQGMVEDGDKIPKPSNIESITVDPARKGAVAFLVSPSSERTVRRNISAKESQIKQIDNLAQKAGMSLSAYVVQAAISKKSRQRL